MHEYRIVAYDQDSEDKLIRAVHADDLCAAVWQMQEELRSMYKEIEDEEAIFWLKRFNEILEVTGAQTVMDHYRKELPFRLCETKEGGGVYYMAIAKGDRNAW